MYSGAKEWIVSEQSNHRKQSSNTEVFRWGLGTPGVPWGPFWGGGVVCKVKPIFTTMLRCYCFFSHSFIWCFPEATWYASVSLTPTGYSTVQLNPDTDCQSWYGLHRLTVQSHKNAHLRHLPQMGSSGDPHFCLAACRFGSSHNLPCPCLIIH